MAVYTEVSVDEAASLLRQLGLGELQSLQACADGVENTNYFVRAELAGQPRDYVLTLFERLTLTQLPFYLQLMRDLAQRGLPVPEPHANAQGELAFKFKGKPAAIVNRLPGASVLNPAPAHCAAVGADLARLHLQGRDFSMTQPNPRGLSWWNETAPLVLPFLNLDQVALLRSELAYQNHVAQSAACAALPRGAIHADLFRDNVMFENVAGKPRLSGIFDFYFAGVDSWLFDLAVALNDWCIDQSSGRLQTEHASSLLQAYEAIRPLQAAERSLLSAMLRASALRFWISRLSDFYRPRSASLLTARDPTHSERVLRERARHPQATQMMEVCA